MKSVHGAVQEVVREVLWEVIKSSVQEVVPEVVWEQGEKGGPGGLVVVNYCRQTYCWEHNL